MVNSHRRQGSLLMNDWDRGRQRYGELDEALELGAQEYDIFLPFGESCTGNARGPFHLTSRSSPNNRHQGFHLAPTPLSEPP